MKRKLIDEEYELERNHKKVRMVDDEVETEVAMLEVPTSSVEQNRRVE